MQIYIMLLLKNDIINEKRKTISQKEFLSFASLSSFFLQTMSQIDYVCRLDISVIFLYIGKISI